MIVRSICIWFGVSFIWIFLMNPIISRDNAHNQRLADIEKEIMEVKSEIEQEQSNKAALLKQWTELPKKIEDEIERGESAKANVENKPNPKSSLPPKSKQIYWDKTPSEQGLKVGDWINIDGYTGQLIGAEAIGSGGKVVGWKWIENKFTMNSSIFTIASQPTGLSAPHDQIVNIMGLMGEHTKSSEIERFNDDYIEKWYEDEKGYVRVTGEISNITPPDDDSNRYPGQWGIDLKTGSIYIELME